MHAGQSFELRQMVDTSSALGAPIDLLQQHDVRARLLDQLGNALEVALLRNILTGVNVVRHHAYTGSRQRTGGACTTGKRQGNQRDESDSVYCAFHCAP